MLLVSVQFNTNDTNIVSYKKYDSYHFTTKPQGTMQQQTNR